MLTIWKEINKPLLIPHEYLSRLDGHKGKKIPVIATESGEVIVTRNPGRYEAKYCVEIGKNDDFVPTAVLKVAKIDKCEEFKIGVRGGDLVVIGVSYNTDIKEQEILKPRILDI
jgi:hypothetical protein